MEKLYHTFHKKSIAKPNIFKATPHKDRLTALQRIYLHIFWHLAHKFFDIRQYACKISAQSAEKSDCVSAPQSLCGVALNFQCVIKNLSPCGSGKLSFIEYLGAITHYALQIVPDFSILSTVSAFFGLIWLYFMCIINVNKK